MRAFTAVLSRDVLVTWRELPSFLLQTIVQPLFVLFVFGTVLTDLGYVQSGYGAVLLPGIIALTGFFGAVQQTSIPLTLDFSWTREIEDRLLAPMPIHLVGVEKILFGALRGLVSALCMVPIGFVLLDTTWPLPSLPLALGVLTLGTFCGAALGLVLGTVVHPDRINTVFAVLVTPMMFTGATQFPLPQLDNLPWFQWVCALNPLTYVSEGMRALLVPAVPHVPLWVCLDVLFVTTALFGWIGVKGFLRRSLD
ncbi:transport permease protein [Lentzea sp. NBRC 105346]|uniref:ABC transporter permease n=1 Tax=Lentzea sp. NBRC 105346 TaxID=3032205 RepID=UPI0024A5B311|nr:ABC transporter permease [Lentzea sp. NBRC 105346]GLZ28545.1 transport permease protein [Lentzea sp. NBRC 105346]